MKRLLTALALAGSDRAPALAAEPESCGDVRFSDVGWTDITATTAVTGTVLRALGYETEVEPPVGAGHLCRPRARRHRRLSRQLDADHGGRYRAATATTATVEVVRVNLDGAKYTLAVSNSLAEKGLKDFSDIEKFAEELDNTIYGIEPGNDGNRLILDMIDADKFGLGDFELKESNEQGMLAQAMRAERRRRGHRLPRLGAASDEHHRRR